MLVRGALSALLTSLLLYLSFPNWHYACLVWVALVPLLVTLVRCRPFAAFALSSLSGISFIMALCFWTNAVEDFKWFDFILSSSYFGIYFGVFGVLFNLASRRNGITQIVTAPLLWIVVEFFRSNAGSLALPWALLGHTQYLMLPIMQIVAYTGVYGISFLIVMVNAALSEALLHFLAMDRSRSAEFRPALRVLAVPSMLVSLVSLYGSYVLTTAAVGESVSVTVIQPNIAQDLKWHPALLADHVKKHVWLSQEAAQDKATSLIVWPEGAVEGFIAGNLSLQRVVINLAKETDTHLLIGSAQRPKFGSREFRRIRLFNSAFLVSPSLGIAQQYHKMRLLPFAEYLPANEFFPWPARYTSGAGNYIPGNDYTLFDLNGTKFGVAICWENIFSGHFRQFVKSGARFMINITNEAWFMDSSAPYQFLSMAVLRAVENRVSIVRSANTGISGFIDPYGRVTRTVQVNGKETFVEGYLSDAVALNSTRTFYTLHGDVFAYGCIFASLLLLIALAYSNRSGARGASPYA